MKFLASSDRSVLLKFGDTISEEHHESVLRFMKILLRRPLSAVSNIHPAYSSILVSFDPLRTTHKKIERWVRSLSSSASQTPPRKSILVEIPVCYGDEFGPDLHDVARHCRLSESDVTGLHSSAMYRVYFLGFSPGFPYLGGMPEQLAVPRLPVPRSSVPAGSVAIGGAQTGVYPLSSPGGWRIIGRTPFRLFDEEKKNPALLSMGDRVQFRQISREEYSSIERSSVR